MPNPQAEAIKTKGNEFFKAGKFEDAIAKYREATAIDPNVASYWSNMAACYEKLGKYEEMAEASRSCIKADKAFVKGYFRLAVAYKQLNDLNNCIKTLESGLAVQSSNADLKKMKKEVTELQRGEQVAAFCNKAEELMQNGDIPGAMKQLDLASRMDAGNPDIQRMMDKVKPKYEAMEAKRKANLSPVERFKEQGDQAYKNANFEDAVAHYTKCIEQLEKDGKQGSDLALKAYANRAGKSVVYLCVTMVWRVFIGGFVSFSLVNACIIQSNSRLFLYFSRRRLTPWTVSCKSCCLFGTSHIASIVSFAACYKQISNFDGVISDCSAVLEVEPDNVKALIRRAQAFEGVERYRFALQDVKTVLQMPYQQVGKTNYDLCNGMQHRLQRTVDQLKKMNS
jgi:tetratricopeptide (TPR) repeat protein